MTSSQMIPRPSLTILGGGPGGYEAAMVAAKFGADVTIVERKGLGGSAVLTDVVPSKTLVATADSMRRVVAAPSLGVNLNGATPSANMREVDRRLLALATQQSTDIRRTLERRGVRVIIGEGRLTGPHTVEVTVTEQAATEEITTGDVDDVSTHHEAEETRDGRRVEVVESDAILVSVGARPRELPTAMPDGERIFNWTQVYALTDVPEHMIVVGSGVTGAEFASAYSQLGAKVSLVSSRDRVLPGEDPDAADALQDAFAENGVNVVARTRAESVERRGDGVLVTLNDGNVLEGSHCLLAVGGVPNTSDIGLEETGVNLTESGHVAVDGVSRTSVASVYAAGDCTGVNALASVAAMQGRIAVAHLMGDAVRPFRPHLVASNVFTSPEIATVGVTAAQVESGKYQADILTLDLATNPRAKMQNVPRGFVKILSRRGSGTVIGGVVVAPRASELIYPIALAVTHKLHVDDMADTFTVYPSISGSISEAARRLHVHL